MSGYNLYGSETIGLRGYTNESLTVGYSSNIYEKFTTELRYPLTLQPQAAIYLLAFLEAGNSWFEFNTYKPFNLHRSAGVGIRLFLPMIGMLGVDWGYGFDAVPGKSNAHQGQFHFQIGMPF
jgi:outer membrane protein insertion porin family